MELYLGGLEEKEQESSEGSPFSSILSDASGPEDIAPLQLDQAGIRVGRYLTRLPPKNALESKLHESIALPRTLLESRAGKPGPNRVERKARTPKSD
jgi:hypothetical protein